MKIFLDYISNQQVITDAFAVREVFDGVLCVKSKLVDGVNDVLTKFEYVLTPIDPIVWKETKKKAVPAKDDATVAGAVKRILQQYLKKLNLYYTNQIITLLHGATFHYPESADSRTKAAMDEKAIAALNGFKIRQYERLLDRQSLLKSRASSLHGFLCKTVEEALNREGAIQFYVCKLGVLGETMLIPGIKDKEGEEPTFYFMIDGLNVQDV